MVNNVEIVDREQIWACLSTTTTTTIIRLMTAFPGQPG